MNHKVCSERKKSMIKKKKARRAVYEGIRRMVLWLSFAFILLFLIPMGILLLMVSGMGILSDRMLNWLEEKEERRK